MIGNSKKNIGPLFQAETHIQAGETKRTKCEEQHLKWLEGEIKRLTLGGQAQTTRDIASYQIVSVW